MFFKATGNKAYDVFKNESGGHRWQRIPPTERKGRVHTSTITVAVLKEPSESELSINPCDIEMIFTKGSGPGGQNRNKVETCVVLRHKPSGITVRAETQRSQYQNRQLAMSLLRAKVLELRNKDLSNKENSSRKQQIGTGMRGDKVRTIRTQNGMVTNHKTGRKARLSDYLKGDLSIAR